MKELRKNIAVVLIIFLCLFTLLAGYFLYDALIYSGRWISSAYNPRLRERRTSVIPGSIYDKNGLELAGSSHDKRTYISDDDLRLSVSHVIGDIYGFSPLGVETTQGAWLLGFNEDMVQRISRVLLGETAHGNDLTLTIDAELNLYIAQQLEGYRGAATVINYQTGEILAMVSLPEFDLKQIDVNLKHGGADEESLVNRALQFRYPPGEIFKVVTAAAAMEYLDLSNRTFACKGSYFTEDGSISCDELHGDQTFEQAVSNFCSSTFAQLSVEIGAAKLQRTAQKLGFNYQFLFSDLAVYDSQISLNSLTSEYDLAYAGLGEYDVAVTPIHMAMLYGAIANGGKIVPLKLLENIEDVDMSKRSDTLRKSFDYAVADKLNDILKDSEPIIVEDVLLLGSCAEVRKKTEEYNKVSWYAGYSDNKDCPYSIAIAMEDYYKDADSLKLIAENIFETIIGNGE